MRGIRRQAGGVGAAHDDHAESLGNEPARCNQRIAAIVAGTDQNQNGTARFAGQCDRQFSGGGTGFFHQRVKGMGGQPLSLAGPDIGSHE